MPLSASAVLTPPVESAPSSAVTERTISGIAIFLGAFLLFHGVIAHGGQLLSPALRREPAGYDARSSGIGMALRGIASQPLRVGVIGLGAGTMARTAGRAMNTGFTNSTL